ncbi:MAG TPA: hypothetical protein VFH61_08145 [Thermoleophilia bacterium]|nr:hypothetical protein [Thermoleophilia bacterium]
MTNNPEHWTGGTIFCDLDGTLFKRGTHDLLPGAKELLSLFAEFKMRVILVTRRGDVEFKGHPVYSKDATLDALMDHALELYEVIYDVRSPRILVDDNDIECLQGKTDAGFMAQDLASVREWLDEYAAA